MIHGASDWGSTESFSVFRIISHASFTSNESDFVVRDPESKAAPWSHDQQYPKISDFLREFRKARARDA
jgi:hypothetical protein